VEIESTRQEKAARIRAWTSQHNSHFEAGTASRNSEHRSSTVPDLSRYYLPSSSLPTLWFCVWKIQPSAATQPYWCRAPHFFAAGSGCDFAPTRPCIGGAPVWQRQANFDVNRESKRCSALSGEGRTFEQQECLTAPVYVVFKGIVSRLHVGLNLRLRVVRRSKYRRHTFLVFAQALASRFFFCNRAGIVESANLECRRCCEVISRVSHDSIQATQFRQQRVTHGS
jgi:hypothetical protein